MVQIDFDYFVLCVFDKRRPIKIFSPPLSCPHIFLAYTNQKALKRSSLPDLFRAEPGDKM